MGSIQMFILLAMPPLLEDLGRARLLASPHYKLYKRYFLEFVAWLLVGGFGSILVNVSLMEKGK